MVPKPPAFLEDLNLGPWAWAAVSLTLITLWLLGTLWEGPLLLIMCFSLSLGKKKLKPQGVKARKRLPLPWRIGDRDRK